MEIASRKFKIQNYLSRFRFKIFIQQQNKWEVRRVFLATILPPTNVPSFDYGKIYKIILGPTKNHKQYEVT